MKETLRHREAFEYYYSLGAARNLLKVSQKVGVSLPSVKKWCKTFGWVKRVERRDKDNAAVLAKRTDKYVVGTKEIYRKEIRETLQVIRRALNLAITRIKDGSLQVDSAKDLASLATAQKELVRLDLLLLGEADQREEHVIRWELVDARNTNQSEQKALPVAEERS